MKKAYCYNCGVAQKYNKIYPIDEALQKTWQITDATARIFNLREGSLCATCGANIRAQGLAKAILESKYGYKQKNLQAWVEFINSSKNLAICELNSCHQLHETLKNLNNLTYAEYGTDSEQNIESLTYDDNKFDIVLHSETLEHVNDPKKAMDECRRVLKSDGIILFTTPVIWSRTTRQRAKIEKKKIIKILKSSYHGIKRDDYLVFYEYGRDIDQLLGVQVAYYDWKAQNYAFSSAKKSTKMKKLTKLKLRLLEAIAINGRSIRE